MTDIVHRIDSCIACRNKAEGLTKAEPIVPANTMLYIEKEDDGQYLVFHFADDGNMVPVTRTGSFTTAQELADGHNATL
jgi:hypothetical protein